MNGWMNRLARLEKFIDSKGGSEQMLAGTTEQSIDGIAMSGMGGTAGYIQPQMEEVDSTMAETQTPEIDDIQLEDPQYTPKEAAAPMEDAPKEEKPMLQEEEAKPTEEVALEEEKSEEAPMQEVEIPQPETERPDLIKAKSQGEFRDELESKLVDLLTNKEILSSEIGQLSNANMRDIKIKDLMPREFEAPKAKQESMPTHTSNKEAIELGLGLTSDDLEGIAGVPVEEKQVKDVNNTLKNGTLEQVVDKIEKIRDDAVFTFDPEKTKYEDIGKDFKVEYEPTKENASTKPSGKTMTPVPSDITFEYAKERDFSSVNINNATVRDEATIELRKKYGDIVALSERDWLDIKDEYRKDFKNAVNKIKEREGVEYFKHAGDKVSDSAWTPADKRYHSRVADRFGKSSEISSDEYTRIADRLKAYENKVTEAYRKESKEEQLVVKRDLEKGIAHNASGRLALVKKQLEKLLDEKGKEAIKTKEWKELKAKEQAILKEKDAN